MNKKIQISVLSIFVAVALLGSLVTSMDNQAFATKKKINESEQSIGQNTTTLQDAICDSEADTLASCNNVALSFNLNDGNNAAGQQ
jgi:cell division protein FtsL